MDENMIVFLFFASLLSKERKRKKARNWKEGEVEKIWEKLGEWNLWSEYILLFEKEKLFSKRKNKKKENKTSTVRRSVLHWI